MRIVSREEFLEMPAGTLFAKYQPCHSSEPMIKGETIRMGRPGQHDGICNNDFYYSDLLKGLPEADNSGAAFDLCFKMEADSTLDVPFDDAQRRDGMFDKKQLFVIFSEADILTAIKNMTTRIKVVI